MLHQLPLVKCRLYSATRQEIKTFVPSTESDLFSADQDSRAQAKQSSGGKRHWDLESGKQEESSPVTREAAHEQAFCYENRTRPRNRRS